MLLKITYVLVMFRMSACGRHFQHHLGLYGFFTHQDLVVESAERNCMFNCPSLKLSVFTGFADPKVAPTSPIECARARAPVRACVCVCVCVHVCVCVCVCVCPLESKGSCRIVFSLLMAGGHRPATATVANEDRQWQARRRTRRSGPGRQTPSVGAVAGHCSDSPWGLRGQSMGAAVHSLDVHLLPFHLPFHLPFLSCSFRDGSCLFSRLLANTQARPSFSAAKLKPALAPQPSWPRAGGQGVAKWHSEPEV